MFKKNKNIFTVYNSCSNSMRGFVVYYGFVTFMFHYQRVIMKQGGKPAQNLTADRYG